MQSFPGHPLPLGATLHHHYTQFAIFSRHAEQVWLMLFDQADQTHPSQEFALDPIHNRTGDIWHIAVSGVKAGQCYLYRMTGPQQPKLGLRYDREQMLIDPYAKSLSGTLNTAPSVLTVYPQPHAFPKCVVINDNFDWQGDKPLNRPLRQTIIYEAHVRGLTQHPSAPTNFPGTYLGLIDLIPYFQDLGVTAIELLPIQSFDHSGHGYINPDTGQHLTNYWGYNPANFFAPESRYAHQQTLNQAVSDFKTMVREMHRAGLEIILDVVYNHTAEGGHLGPTFSFRGIDNPIYYLLEKDPYYYCNYAGTGNTFNCNHPVGQDLILDSLRYWVSEMHVDGFRFDLATILTRGQQGQLLENPPLVERIAEDPLLRQTKIIAEAWDATGAYQVGAFPGRRWAEWNGRYRDDVRRFWRGDLGLVGALATRFAGSSDLYSSSGRTPFHSINFITAHDGFTLNDLVSYQNKYNLANGENNQDGDNHNFSHNLGQEGPSADPAIESYRRRRIKNFLTTLMLSQGVPMLLGGDEFRRTQKGNNNAYVQDNEISWLDWSFKEIHAEIYRFAKTVIAFRKQHPIFYRPHFFEGKNGSILDIQWFSAACQEADWGQASQQLMCLIYGHLEVIGSAKSDHDVLIMFNASLKSQSFRLPIAPDQGTWYRVIDTALCPPQDICELGQETILPSQTHYFVQDQSMVVLLSKTIHHHC